MMHKKIQSGRSMVEMLGVLAIIGVLSIGGIAGYSMAMEKYRINQALENIQLIVQETRNTFITQENFEGLGYSWDDGSVATSIINKVAGNSFYSIRLEEYWRGRGFEINIYGLSVSACVSISTQVWSGFRENYKSTSVGNQEDYNDFSVSNAALSCKEGTDQWRYVRISFYENGDFSEIVVNRNEH